MFKTIRYRYVLYGFLLFVITALFLFSAFYFTITRYHFSDGFNRDSELVIVIFRLLRCIPFIIMLFFNYLAVKPIVNFLSKICAYILISVIEMALVIVPYVYASIYVICKSGFDCY
jgi:hypothetical protein